MRTEKKIISLLIILMLFALALPGCKSSDKTDSSDTNTQPEPKALVVELTATDTTDALELLREKYEVDYQSSMMGSFVTGIGSVENSSAGYWVYKVNDTTPKIACDKMILMPGDRLKWLFQSSDESEPAKTE